MLIFWNDKKENDDDNEDFIFYFQSYEFLEHRICFFC